MLAMIAHIELMANERRQGFELRHIASCKIDSSWEDLTDTAQIELPRNIKLPKLHSGQPTNLKQWIRQGDRVRIRLGYNSNLRQEFIGYVTDITTDLPVRIRCEDAMWKLKQVSASYASKHTKLPELLGRIVPSTIATDVANSDIGSFRTKRSETVAQVLSRLKDYGVYSYFRKETLVCGKIYTGSSNAAKFDFTKNIISNNLRFRLAEDIKVKVVATSVLTNGDRIEVAVGDLDGHVHKLSYFNVQDKDTLKRYAFADLQRLKVDGYHGSFLAFGDPFVVHGNTCELADPHFPERSGRYFIKRVATNFSKNGFRRTIHIDKKAR